MKIVSSSDRPTSAVLTKPFLKFLSIVSLFSLLTACSINRVQFLEQETKPGATHRQVRAVQKWCEVERQMALYSDVDGSLWLSCPYRYEGRVVPSMSLISANAHKGETDFAYDTAVQRAQSMRRIPLRNCGNSRWCADVSHLDYHDFSVQFLGQTAQINYTDLSPGRSAVAAFYAGLDGKPGALPLEPALMSPTGILEPL